MIKALLIEKACLDRLDDHYSVEIASRNAEI